MSRHEDARKIRRDAAEIAHDRPYTHDDDHKDNKEEEDYHDAHGNRNFIGNFSKGLPHHPIGDAEAGEVFADAYRTMLKAIKSEKVSDFESIQLGLGRKLTNPQAGIAFDLEGPDCHDLFQRPAPRIDGAEAAAEMAELYWMALCRDVKFGDFSTDATVLAAVGDLSTNYTKFPIPNTPVTTGTIFRGFTGGDSKGPYISQFLYKDVNWGSMVLEQKQRIALGGKNGDYLYEYPKWLEAQNGKNVDPADNLIGTKSDTRYIVTPRDLAYYVHVDALYEAYLHAALILLHHNAPVDPGNPYGASQTQIGFGTFGGPHILSLVTEVASRALKAVWYQKWFVHRRLRAEAFGGLIHRMKNTVSPPSTPTPPYPINNEILNSQVLPKIFSIYGSYLLPQAFPEGSPTHPSYGAGHATVAGACVTILKAWFKEDTKIKDLFDPVMPDPADDSKLTNGVFNGADLTIEGELNKVAANVAIGRNWGGVHYRSDYKESVELGEKVAIGILEEQKITFNEKSSFSIKKFDGTTKTV